MTKLGNLVIVLGKCMMALGTWEDGTQFQVVHVHGLHEDVETLQEQQEGLQEQEDVLQEQQEVLQEQTEKLQAQQEELWAQRNAPAPFRQG